MIALSKEGSLKYAIEIAKIVCENPSTKLDVSESSAEHLGKFVLKLAETLHGGSD